MLFFEKTEILTFDFDVWEISRYLDLDLFKFDRKDVYAHRFLLVKVATNCGNRTHAKRFGSESLKYKDKSGKRCELT